MSDRTKLFSRAIFFNAAFLTGIFVSIGFTGGISPKPAKQASQSAPRRYPLNGRIVSVEKAKQQIVVDHKEIPGFMMAMTMGYSVKNPNQLDPLSAEDQITADVVGNCEVVG